VAAEAGGIDASDVEAFDAWVTADPAHLDQVLPEPRGVVALMPRVTDIDYGDPWTNTRMSEANQESCGRRRRNAKAILKDCGRRVPRR